MQFESVLALALSMQYINQNKGCVLQKTQCMTINNCRGSRILPMKSTTIMTESLCKGEISVSPRLGRNS